MKGQHHSAQLRSQINFIPKAIWFTGLSSSGKTTLSFRIAAALLQKSIPAQVLDGDVLRKGLNRDLGFDLAAREENIRRAAEVANILIQSGMVCLCSFITPTVRMRQKVQQIIGPENLIEIYVNAPLHICEKRDVKGLYQKAREGIVTNFTGISSPFEPPESPDIEVLTDELSIDEAVAKCLTGILPKVLPA